MAVLRASSCYKSTIAAPPCGPTGSVEASRGRRGCRVGRSHGLMVHEGGQRPPEGTNRPTVDRPRLQTCVIRPTEQLSRPVSTGSAHRVVLFRPYGDSHVVRCVSAGSTTLIFVLTYRKLYLPIMCSDYGILLPHAVVCWRVGVHACAHRARHIVHTPVFMDSQIFWRSDQSVDCKRHESGYKSLIEWL